MELQTVLLGLITIFLGIIMAILVVAFVGIYYLRKKVKYLRLLNVSHMLTLYQLGKRILDRRRNFVR